MPLGLATKKHINTVGHGIIRVTNREFLKTYGGKLAAVAAFLNGLLGAIAIDPSIAALVIPFLSFPLNLIFLIGLIVATYILPLWAQKKDVNDGLSTAEDE